MAGTTTICAITGMLRGSLKAPQVTTGSTSLLQALCSTSCYTCCSQTAISTPDTFQLRAYNDWAAFQSPLDSVCGDLAVWERHVHQLVEQSACNYLVKQVAS